MALYYHSVGRVPFSYPLCLRFPTALPVCLSYACSFCFCSWSFIRFLWSVRVLFPGIVYGIAVVRIVWCPLEFFPGSFTVLVHALFYGDLFLSLSRSFLFPVLNFCTCIPQGERSALSTRWIQSPIFNRNRIEKYTIIYQ